MPAWTKNRWGAYPRTRKKEKKHEKEEGCVPKNTHPSCFITALFCVSVCAVPNKRADPHFGTRQAVGRNISLLKSIYLIFILGQECMNNPALQASTIKDRIIEDGLHPHPGPKTAGSSSRRRMRSCRGRRLGRQGWLSRRIRRRRCDLGCTPQLAW